jgi:hypothetical protein
LEEGVEYLVEKAYRNRPDFAAREVIFDYALCNHCATQMVMAPSTESLANLQRHFSENISLHGMQQMPEGEEERTRFMLDHCVVKGVSRDKTEEYQIVARCKGGFLAPNHFPVLLSFEALDELSALLSEKTQENLNNFRDQFFPVPPEYEDIFKTRPPVLVI